MKRWGVSAGFLLIVAGCSSSGGSVTNDGEEQIELTFSTWGNENHIAVYEELLEAYYVDHPNVNVTIQTTPFPDYQQNMTVLAAGQELPDIGWAAERMVPQFIENNILADIGVLRQDESFNFDDILPGTITQYEVDDALYGVPFSSPPHIIYYNKTLFEEKGLDTPQELESRGDWTWELLKKPQLLLPKMKVFTVPISFGLGKRGKTYLLIRELREATFLTKRQPSLRGTVMLVFRH